MRRALKRTMVFGAGAAVFLAAMPTLATAAEKFTDVVVRNTSADPVITRSTGTTDVSGTVSLSEGAAVGISNTSDSPVPVELVGGPDPQRWTAASGFTFLPAEDVTAISEVIYTVPSHSSFVVTTATGYVSPAVGSMSIYGDCPGQPSVVHGVFDGTDSFGFKAWHTTGEAGFGPGCTLRIRASHESGGATDSAKMELNGYLTPAG